MFGHKLKNHILGTDNFIDFNTTLHTQSSKVNSDLKLCDAVLHVICTYNKESDLSLPDHRQPNTLPTFPFTI